jgi:TRAP-type C4-dicarboxylate transport system substrate-binding protein
MWDGFWLLANRRAFEKLPPDIQEITARELNRAAVDERADVAALNGALRGKLATSGLAFNEVDTAPFRAALKQAGFYADWRGKYGDAAWKVLEDAVGGLS